MYTCVVKPLKHCRQIEFRHKHKTPKRQWQWQCLYIANQIKQTEEAHGNEEISRSNERCSRSRMHASIAPHGFRLLLHNNGGAFLTQALKSGCKCILLGDPSRNASTMVGRTALLV